MDATAAPQGTADGGVPDAGADAAPQKSKCINSTTPQLPAGTPYAAVSDGTTVYAALSTNAGSQLYETPLVGGAPTLIATASQGRFALASSGSAIFYAAKLGGADYEVHQRVGTIDTLLGSVAASTDLVIAANSTDVYIAGDAAISLLSRSGPPDQTPNVLASSAGIALRIALGPSIVAWRDTQGTWRVMPLAKPGSPTTITAQNYGAVEMAGDIAIELSGKILTSHTTSYSWSVIYPTTELMGTTTATGHWFEMIAANATHIFVRETYRPDPSYYATESRLISFALDDSHRFAGRYELCNYLPTPIGHDATYVFVRDERTSSLVAIPIP